MIKSIHLAGGCFWGVEAYYRKLKGVVDVSVGYADGNTNNPSYYDLIDGLATHSEAVKVTYDSSVVDLDFILKHYFSMINPYLLNRQGNDRGIQYRTAIYTNNYLEILDVINYMLNLFKTDFNKVVVEVKVLTNYFVAEEYHQDYLTKNPNGYCHIDLSKIESGDLKWVKQII